MGSRGAGGHGRAAKRGAWPGCRWAAAGPGRTTSRRAKPHASTPVPTGAEGAGGTGGTGGPGCGARGRRRGLAGLRGAGPGRGAGGRRQGQGGPRDRPLRAAGSRVAISRAGRRPPAHTAARPPRGARNTSGATSINTRRGRLAGGPPPTGAQSSPTRHTTRSRPAPSGPGGTRVRRQLSEAAAQLTLHVAPSRPSATVTPAAARRSRSSSARAQSLAARAAARSSSTA